MELGLLAYYDKRQLYDKGHNSESYIFGVMPLFNSDVFLSKVIILTQISVKMLTPHVVILFYI
jgi:hypothetical protein